MILTLINRSRLVDSIHIRPKNQEQVFSGEYKGFRWEYTGSDLYSGNGQFYQYSFYNIKTGRAFLADLNSDDLIPDYKKMIERNIDRYYEWLSKD